MAFNRNNIDTLLFGILYYIVTRRWFNSRFRNLFVYKKMKWSRTKKKKCGEPNRQRGTLTDLTLLAINPTACVGRHFRISLD